MLMKTRVHSTRRSASRAFGKPVCAFVTALVFILFCSRGFTQTTPSNPDAANVRVGVLGLFHPRELTVSALPGHALVLRAGDERIVLEYSSGVPTASVRLSRREIVVQSTRTMRVYGLTIAGRRNEPVEFVLAVPGKIARHYRGKLEILPSAGHLLAIVTMDRETAVASIVAAESTSETPIEALKAQAVATRSYLAASRG